MKVVIVGAGFGGLRAARSLKRAPVEVTVVDRSNHHLFQPLLYQVATAELSPADIASPIRSVLADQPNAEVLMAEVVGVDMEKRQVLLRTVDEPSTFSLPYDVLVIATGARHTYFGRDEWEKFAPGLKTIADATWIRQKILYAFERAEMENDPERRAELLHFVLVGGGPTGVEMAGAIAELAHIALVRDFRRIHPESARITLIEAGPRVLHAFPESLSHRATEDLKQLGVDVRTGTQVDNITDEGVWIKGECLRARTIIWTAGVQASPAGKWLGPGTETDRAGRVRVLGDLTVPGHPEIYVIGDTAWVTGPDGKPLPGVAPVAMQQGTYVGKAIAKRAEGERELQPFEYWDKGNLATIGRKSAVADLGKVKLTGTIAWLAWLVVHIFYLIGFRNRLLVILEWAWSYLMYSRGARLIVMYRPILPLC